ncbi:MAG: response regulator [Syntrophomonadaceae bacterium]|nr:response regulator [Syntrophomonadaceae bacterium]
MNKTIMLVDDSTFMRHTLSQILTKNNYTVIAEASNGVEALELYRKFQPDLVTLDITMPEMNGLAALEAILAEDPAARIIMVSAIGQTSFIKQALSAGARDFIVKPFKEEQVIQAINRCFET